MRDETSALNGEISKVKGEMQTLDSRLKELEDAGGGRGLPSELGAPLRAFWVNKRGGTPEAWPWEQFVVALADELGPQSAALVASLDERLLRSRHGDAAAACKKQLDEKHGRGPLAASVATQCVLHHLLDSNQDGGVDASELRALHLRCRGLLRVAPDAASGGLTLLQCLELVVGEACDAKATPPSLDLNTMLWEDVEALRKLLDPLDFKDDLSRLYDKLLPGR